MKIGSRVQLCDGRKGFIRSSQVLNSGSKRIGIELDAADGWGDGECGGERLFHTRRGHAMFVDSEDEIKVIHEDFIRWSTRKASVRLCDALIMGFRIILYQCALVRVVVSSFKGLLADSTFEANLSTWLLFQAVIPVVNVLFFQHLKVSRSKIVTVARCISCLLSKKWLTAISLFLMVLPLPSSPFWWTALQSSPWGMTQGSLIAAPKRGEWDSSWTYLDQLNLTQAGYLAPLTIVHHTDIVSRDLDLLQTGKDIALPVRETLQPALELFVSYANNLHDEMMEYYTLIDVMARVSLVIMNDLERLDSRQPQRLYGGFNFLSAPLETSLITILPALARPTTVDVFFNPRIPTLIERGRHLEGSSKVAEAVIADAIIAVQAFRAPLAKLYSPRSFAQAVLSKYNQLYFEPLEVTNEPGTRPKESMRVSLERLHHSVKVVETVSTEQRKTCKIILAQLHQLASEIESYRRSTALQKVNIRQMMIEYLRQLVFAAK